MCGQDSFQGLLLSLHWFQTIRLVQQVLLPTAPSRQHDWTRTISPSHQHLSLAGFRALTSSASSCWNSCHHFQRLKSSEGWDSLAQWMYLPSFQSQYAFLMAPSCLQQKQRKMLVTLLGGNVLLWKKTKTKDLLLGVIPGLKTISTNYSTTVQYRSNITFSLKSGQEYLPLRGSEMTSSGLLTSETISSSTATTNAGPTQDWPCQLSFTNGGGAHKALSFITKIIGY